MNYPVEAREAIDPIIDLAIRHNYKKRLCQIYTILGGYYCCVEEDLPHAFNTLYDALEISKEVKDDFNILFEPSLNSSAFKTTLTIPIL